MKLDFDDYKLYLEHVPGVLAIDNDGSVIYMSEQCADYLLVDRDESIGKNIIDVFPYTQMIEGLKYNKIRIVFYNTNVGIGISVHVPIYKNDIKIGLLEYDVIQGSEFLYDFADRYRQFLDREFKFLSHEIMNLTGTKYTINNIIGNSDQIVNLREHITQAAHTNSSVLITGETGTGKELVAHSIHNLSNRRNNSFVRINASALPESLAESELFGYDGGSFTGAIKEGKKGKFEQADTGTFFIDEINQMPMSLQPKLLRVLQEKEINRIGGSGCIPVDVRIITATNKDLRQLIKEGKFREDLYYRLNVIEIHTPPLRDRIDDIPLLTQSVVVELNPVMGKRVTKVNPVVYDMFKSYDWPGNVRELHNVIERAMNYVEGDTLLPEHFKFKQVIFERLEKRTYREININTDKKDIFESISPIEALKNAAERELLIKVIFDCDNNKSKAAKVLKISRPLLYQKMKRLNIKL
ncbi:MAG: sigma 54-interacting transcriptional regulator [Eubacteriales bacterium]|nr:sigma 54-interacting transcriptional regulator [Eubacteriales bacterium]